MVRYKFSCRLLSVVTAKLSNRKLDETRTHQTDSSLFLKLQIRKI